MFVTDVTGKILSHALPALSLTSLISLHLQPHPEQSMSAISKSDVVEYAKVYNFIWYTPRNTPDFDELVELIYEDVKKLPYETLKRNADGGDYDSILQLAMRYVPKSESQARLADSYIDLTPAVACPKAPMDPLTS